MITRRREAELQGERERAARDEYLERVVVQGAEEEFGKGGDVARGHDVGAERVDSRVPVVDDDDGGVLASRVCVVERHGETVAEVRAERSRQLVEAAQIADPGDAALARRRLAQRSERRRVHAEPGRAFVSPLGAAVFFASPSASARAGAGRAGRGAGRDAAGSPAHRSSPRDGSRREEREGGHGGWAGK